MKFKKSQSGRSMVEMLGVLAIIGVLSVGGIAGYTLSMRRHRANGVVDTFAKYALMGYTDCQKKLIDGEVGKLSHCHYSVSFKDAGIVNLPQGVREVMDYIKPDPNNSGVDTVFVSAKFDDDKLCQAVASIGGVSCDNGHIQLPIKQN